MAIRGKAHLMEGTLTAELVSVMIEDPDIMDDTLWDFLPFMIHRSEYNNNNGERKH